MNLYDFKKLVVKLIDDFDSDNNLTSDEDIRYKLTQFTNSAIIEASQWKKLEKKQVIVQNIPQNTIPMSLYSQDIYAHTNQDLVFKGIGKTYNFMIQGQGTAIISQNGIENIVINNKNTKEFIRYKGFTTGTGEITITFSGEYYFNVRNIAIFDVKYVAEEDIPNWERYIRYDLNKDYYDLKTVMLNGNRASTEDYRELKGYDLKVKQILINGYSIGEFEVYYYSYGKEIPLDITEEDEKAFEFDLDRDIVDSMSFYVAYLVAMTDPSFNSSAFYQVYLNKLEKIQQDQDKGLVSINNLFIE